MLIRLEKTDKSFELSRDSSISLELVFNKSDKGKIWSHIGDKLYNYGIGRIN